MLKMHLPSSIEKGGSVAQHGYCLDIKSKDYDLNSSESASAF